VLTNWPGGLTSACGMSGRRRDLEKIGRARKQPIRLSNHLKVVAENMFKKKQLGPGGYRRPTPTNKETTPSIAETVPQTEYSTEVAENAENVKILDPELEALYKKLRMRWNFMTTDDFAQFDPITVALSFMDTSSLGRDYNAFTSMLQELEKAMDGVVQDYHQDFSDVVATFSGVVENITDASNRAKDVQSGLLLTKELFQGAQTDLHDLWIRNLQYTEMLRLMDTMYVSWLAFNNLVTN